MAAPPSSSSNPNTNDNEPSCLAANTTATTTFFVQADPSNFRAVVQRLTGAPQDPATQKLPVMARLAGKPVAGEIMGMTRRSVFRLHKRRQTGARRLEIKLGGGLQRSFGGEASPLEMLEEEEKAIAEKVFYLHPSPLSTPRGSEPELLPLFPLHSPNHHQHHSSSSSSSSST